MKFIKYTHECKNLSLEGETIYVNYLVDRFLISDKVWERDYILKNILGS